MTKSPADEAENASLGLGGWIVTAALLGILGASIGFAVYGWNLTGAEISTAGVVALSLGVTVSMALGCGLMALVFWSHNKGYDR